MTTTQSADGGVRGGVTPSAPATEQQAPPAAVPVGPVSPPGAGQAEERTSPPVVLSSAPQRIQLRRTRGWRKPEGAIVVARPSKWGNPHWVAQEVLTDHSHNPWWRIFRDGRPAEAFGGRDVATRTVVADFRNDLLFGRLPYSCDDVRAALVGRDLACWCPLDQSCHADVLLEIANGSAA